MPELRAQLEAKAASLAALPEDALAGELADTKKQQDKTEELLCLMTNPAYGRIDVDLDIFEEEEDEI